MSVMRAKMKIASVEKLEGAERLKMNAVCRNGEYPEDGSDENNTYAHFSPSANLEILIANPALFGKFEPGKSYYIDFTEAPE